nr:recombinase family protein [Candidatus Paracaedibacter acanthamoebae]
MFPFPTSFFYLRNKFKKLESQEIGFQSLTEAINTTTSGGRLIFHIFASLAEFERSIIKERTLAGLSAAKRLLLPLYIGIYLAVVALFKGFLSPFKRFCSAPCVIIFCMHEVWYCRICLRRV